MVIQCNPLFPSKMRQAATWEHYSPLSFKMCQLVPATWEHYSPTPHFHKNAPIDVYLSRGNSAPPPAFLKNAPTGVYLPRGNTKLHFLLFIIMAFRLITHFLSKQTNLRKIQLTRQKKKFRFMRHNLYDFVTS